MNIFLAYDNTLYTPPLAANSAASPRSITVPPT
jgi:hypothetical protein